MKKGEKGFVEVATVFPSILKVQNNVFAKKNCGKLVPKDLENMVRKDNAKVEKQSFWKNPNKEFHNKRTSWNRNAKPIILEPKLGLGSKPSSVAHDRKTTAPRKQHERNPRMNNSQYNSFHSSSYSGPSNMYRNNYNKRNQYMKNQNRKNVHPNMHATAFPNTHDNVCCNSCYNF